MFKPKEAEAEFRFWLVRQSHSWPVKWWSRSLRSPCPWYPSNKTWKVDKFCQQRSHPILFDTTERKDNSYSSTEAFRLFLILRDPAWLLFCFTACVCFCLSAFLVFAFPFFLLPYHSPFALSAFLFIGFLLFYLPLFCFLACLLLCARCVAVLLGCLSFAFLSGPYA